MGLWKRIKRLLPIGALAATTAFFIATKPTIPVDPRVSDQEFARLQQEHTGRTRRVLFYGAAGSLATLGLAHLLKRMKGERATLLQPAVEHPWMAGGVIGAAFGAAYQSQFHDAVYAVRAGLMPGMLAYFTSEFLYRVKPPYLLNSARRLRDSVDFLLTSDLERKCFLLERMRTYSPSDSATIDIEHIEVLFKQEKVDAALNLLKETIPHVAEAVRSSLFQRAFSLPVAIAISERKPDFSLAFAYLKRGELTDALDTLGGFVAEQPSPSRFAARAYVTQSLCDLWPSLKMIVPQKGSQGISLEDRARCAWQDSIKVILADPQREQQFKLMGESRNEVLEYAPNRFLQGLLVFKRCRIEGGQRLLDERENMLALREQFGARIAQSLAYVEHDGKAYHVLRHGTSRTLEDVLRHSTPGERLDRLKDSAAFLQELHQARYPCSAPALSDDHYSKRLQQVFYGPLLDSRIHVPVALSALLPELGQRVHAALAQMPVGWYKDANPGNWLVEGDGRIVGIDFEHRIRLPVLLDLVSMLEFAQAPARKDEREVVLEQYRALLGVDRGSWARAYCWAALQRNLELAGYRAADQKFNAVQFHLGRAIGYAHELGEVAVARELSQIRFSET